MEPLNWAVIAVFLGPVSIFKYRNGCSILSGFSLSLFLSHSTLQSYVVLCFHRYGRDAKVVHFLGKVKPWNYSYDAQRSEVKGHSLSPDQCHMHPDYLLMWWQLYAKSVKPLLQQAYGDTPFNSGFVEASEEVRQLLRRLCVCV